MTLQGPVEFVNRKLNALNVTCTKVTKKNLSIQPVPAESNFRLSTKLASSVISKDAQTVNNQTPVNIVKAFFSTN